MTKKLRNRRLNERYARFHGYFWLTCPSCGEFFGGHEWHDVAGHRSDIPTGEAGTGRGICPVCTAAGVGDRAWATADARGVYPQ